jgi:hypothetical protein
VVKVFNTNGVKNMADPDHGDHRVTMLYAGDDTVVTWGNFADLHRYPGSCHKVRGAADRRSALGRPPQARQLLAAREGLDRR